MIFFASLKHERVRQIRDKALRKMRKACPLSTQFYRTGRTDRPPQREFPTFLLSTSFESKMRQLAELG